MLTFINSSEQAKQELAKYERGLQSILDILQDLDPTLYQRLLSLFKQITKIQQPNNNNSNKRIKTSTDTIIISSPPPPPPTSFEQGIQLLQNNIETKNIPAIQLSHLQTLLIHFNISRTMIKTTHSVEILKSLHKQLPPEDLRAELIQETLNKWKKNYLI
jgi:hypothetical protein